MTAISDRNPEKWGKLTSGSNIPIISEKESRTKSPDYYFVLAWHFIENFLERENEFLNKGGKLIVPLPEFKIYEKRDL